jgi:DNA-directed RNA polymerase subunit RPC12/RpoP
VKSMYILIDTFRVRITHVMMKLMNDTELKFHCPHCDQPFKCEPVYAGRQIQCPACQHLIRIPNPPPGTGFTHVQPESGRTWDTFPPK